jgi:hypothetical protein
MGKGKDRVLLVVVAEDQQVVTQLLFTGRDPLGQLLCRPLRILGADRHLAQRFPCLVLNCIHVHSLALGRPPP